MNKISWFSLNGKRVWLFAFGISFSLHLIALPFVGKFLEACPTCEPLSLELPPIYARIHNPSETGKQLEKRKDIIQEKLKLTPKQEKQSEKKQKITPQRPSFLQKWFNPGNPNTSSTPGGGAAQVITKTTPGEGGFVVGGIPKPEPGAQGPGLGGSGTAPGVGGSGSEPGMPVSNPQPPQAPPPPKEEVKKEPPPPPKQEPVVKERKEEPPPPPPPPPPPKKQIDPREIAEFQKMIYKKIQSAKDYPYQAKLSGIEGRVKVSFMVRRDGSPINIKVISSSGQEILDNAAIDTVQKAGPYLPFPQSVEAEALKVSVEIVYKLR